jgi:transcriptional regulator with XRE-family HTH domain
MDDANTLERMAYLYARSVSATIRVRRDRSGLSIKEIAKACGVTTSAVEGWLYRSAVPRPAILKKLDDLFIAY